MSIPRVLWQCGNCEIDSLPEHVLYYMDSWKKLNPEWKFEYFTDDEQFDYIKKTRGTEVALHYRRIEKPDIRADMWRYCVIADNGGFYADLDALCRIPIDSWADLSKEFIVAQQFHPGPGDMWVQWFFGAKKQSKIAIEIVETVIPLISKSPYPDVHDSLFPFTTIIDKYKNLPEVQTVVPWHSMGVTHIAAHGKFYDSEYWMKTDFIGYQ